MAKVLLANRYSIDVNNNSVTIPGFHLHEQILLITDVSTGNVLYNFADPDSGATAFTFSEDSEDTTLVLTQDLATLGTTNDSKLSIMVDTPHQEIEFADSLLDPVHKIRVSQPENLIDTDFEYGLQPTKWETLETSNNVPSFYSGDGDLALTGVLSVTTTTGSTVVTVSAGEEHGLAVGTPIDVQGVSSRTAEGKFLISATTTNTFTYNSAAPQIYTGNIGGTYTTITPGSFYHGSSIPFEVSTGLETDQLDPSTITVATATDHGFVTDSNFYLVNSVGTKKFRLTETTTSSAPDSNLYVDPANTIEYTGINNDSTLTETKQIRSRHNLKFTASAVDISANTITWPSHGFRDNDCVMYHAPAGDTQIGGLQSNEVFYIIVVDANTIRFSSSVGGSAIDLTNVGTYTYGRASLNLVYEIYNLYIPYRSTSSQAKTTAAVIGNGSGWDLLAGTPLGGEAVQAYVPFSRTNRYEYYAFNRYMQWLSPRFLASGMTPRSGNIPSAYDMVEDFTRWTSQAWWPAGNTRSLNVGNKDGIFQTNNKYLYDGTYNTNLTRRDMFIMPVFEEEESDTLYIQNHGLFDGDIIEYNSTTSGERIYYASATTAWNSANNRTILPYGSYVVDVVSSDRIRIRGRRIYTASGQYDFSYSARNRTANSFYLENHGFTTNQNVKIYTGVGGVLPSTQTGNVAPIMDPATTNALPIAFKVVKGGVDSYFTTNSVSTIDLVTSSVTGAQSTRVLDNGTASASTGDWNLTYYDLAYSTTRAVYSTVGRAVDVNKNYYNPAVLNSSTATNIFTGSIYEDRNYMMMATDWTANTSIPYYLTLKSTDFATSTEQMYDNFYQGAGVYTPSSPQYGFTNYSERDYTVTSSSNIYRWAASTIHFYTGTRRMVYIRFRFANRSDPTNYYNATAAMRPISASNNNSYFYDYFNSYYMGRQFEGSLIFSVPNATTTFNSATTFMLDFVPSIITAFDEGMVYPTVSSGDTVSVSIIDDNRFSFRKDDVPIDILDSGTAPMEISTVAQLGVVDGIYKATEASDTSIKFQTNSEINGQSAAFDSSEIVGNVIPLLTGETHAFRSGTAVVYSVNGGTSIPELTDGNTYYVIVVDDENIMISDSASDAENGSNELTITAGVGNHTFTSTSLSGVVPAQGTITTESGKNVVIGIDTLFKRYFKVGDTVHIKDNNSTPGTIQQYIVSSIADDTEMYLDRIVNFTATNTKHFVETKMYVRPDGYAVHRPFDGGVEIAAGTAPLSKVTRQTRKYFRYQSGKGIQTSLAINFNPPVTFDVISGSQSSTTVTCKTRYPHRMGVTQPIEIKGASDNSYNGIFEVATVVDENTFTIELASPPLTSIPNGIIKYNLRGYTGAYTRAGMFDDQNGFFYEFDGQTLYACRRSSTTQLSGTVTAVRGSGVISGSGTNFRGQLLAGDNVVIRGMTYKVVSINGTSEMSIQPQYRGISASGIIYTKVETLRVPQHQWNEDVCDGTGPEGFNLNIDKIQMAYMDYSWYGAGKLRFGFKDRKGHVRYVHSFLHNNRLDEAYMRSGNLPAKYEIENGPSPTYAPTLFHWGTSVIMDGRYDDDKAYLFTAPSKALSFTNGDTAAISTNGASILTYTYNSAARSYDWYVRIPFASTNASKFYTGLKLYTANGELTGQEVAYTQYGGSTIYVFVFVTSSRRAPSVYPQVGSSVSVSLGSLPGGGEQVNLGTATIPLVSLRLSPSVDGNLSGALGARDIINRMQLKLNEVGMILTHDCEVKLILNGDLSNVGWETVKSPSLSQLIKHESADTISGGTEVFSFRASGGGTDNIGKRLSASTTFDLGEIIDMGNSILGGDGTFPNGPDVLTVAVQVVDTGGIGNANPFGVSSRITWSESQA